MIKSLLFVFPIFMAFLCSHPEWTGTEADPELPSFPGAEGWGSRSVGGRGGKIIKVTNLHDKGPGSFAEACATPGPRIVVFEVSGVIRGNVVIKHPFITIVGQTAPGAGITLEGMISSYDYGVHDVIIRHLRIRGRRNTGSSGDLLQLGGLGKDSAGTWNIMIDHLSLAWSNDEMIDFYNTHHATVQWCTIEASDTAGHPKGDHNYGIIATAYGSGAISLHHNLWAHHSRRVPCLAPYNKNQAGDFCNNLVYNCRGGYCEDGHGVNAKSPVNLYANYYKRGPRTMSRIYPFAFIPSMEYFVKDNFFEGWGYQDHPGSWKRVKEGGDAPSWMQFNTHGTALTNKAQTPEIRVQTAQEAAELVLARAGCRPRDQLTLRTLQEVVAGTGSWGRDGPDQPSNAWYLKGLRAGTPPPDTDRDGMPDTWEISHQLDPRNPEDRNRIVPENANRDNPHSGYTWIEYYLNELADGLF